MNTYKNLSERSGIDAYEVGTSFIKIRFKGSSNIYVYDASSPGLVHVERMKKLAVVGRGLATYVNQNVKREFSRIE
ncbi:MAG TPA: hypothetical protein VJL58_07355 [Pyrinomonadaceae bacterium]|nr:hypothetical protein [Pyrinomonadaceae bacterium]